MNNDGRPLDWSDYCSPHSIYTAWGLDLLHHATKAAQDDTGVPATTPNILVRWDYGRIYTHINSDIPQDSILPNIFNSIESLN